MRDSTGFSRNPRSADALVVSVWPSRGIWFAGLEVKVARHDWLRELKDPDKSAEIQQYCDYWWIATPPGIVELSELPATWGLIEVGSGRNTVVQAAPKLDAKRLSAGFVAAVLRNRAEAEQRNVARAVEAALSKARQEGAVPGAEELRRTVTQLERSLEYSKRDHAALAEKLRAFEAASGVDVASAWDTARLGAEVALAKRLLVHDEQLEQIESQLTTAVRVVHGVIEALAKLKPG